MYAATLARMITTVVFVHGFNSGPDIWDPFRERMKDDPDFASDRFQTLAFSYPTSLLQLSPTRRIPSIRDCGDALAGYLKLRCKNTGPIFLVGHSMGGLVIEAMMVNTLRAKRGADLKQVRGVILFATPNRGSNTLAGVRELLSKVVSNPQDEGLRTLNEDADDVLRDIEDNVLRATAFKEDKCPIAFQVFYGLEDNVVPKVSARASFNEYGALPGDHHTIVDGGPKRKGDPDDSRYAALKDALLNPVGHPEIYEIDLFEVSLQIEPVSRSITFQIPNMDRALSIQTDNVALRTLTFQFADKNRCHNPYKQVYRSVDGLVEFVSTTAVNQANPVDKSTYRSEGKIYTYVFTPDHGDSFTMRLRIYNGFGQDNRSWHNHMDPKAHYRRMRLQLDLQKYAEAGYTLDPEPRVCYYEGDNTEDHELCTQRKEGKPLPSLPGDSAWLRTWELTDVQGGIVDLVWDVKPPAAVQTAASEPAAGSSAG